MRRKIARCDRSLQSRWDSIARVAIRNRVLTPAQSLDIASALMSAELGLPTELDALLARRRRLGFRRGPCLRNEDVLERVILRTGGVR